jgi:hypothetical protein
MSRVVLSCAVAGLFCVNSAWAHHTVPGRTHPTVTISQQVMVDRQPLAPGTYEIYVTDERPTTGAGTTDGQRVVEFARSGKVVGKTIAELFPAAGNRPVGTSGSTGSSRASAQMLRGGEFLRVSFTDADGRYLIHLPTGPLNEPQPQAQSPSRVELPPQTTPSPSNQR